MKDLVGSGEDPGGCAGGRNLNDVIRLDDSDFGGRIARRSRLRKKRDGTKCLNEENYANQDAPHEFSVQFQRAI
jgi:hypothetical protein